MLAVGHCRGKLKVDRMVITGFYTDQPAIYTSIVVSAGLEDQ